MKKQNTIIKTITSVFIAVCGILNMNAQNYTQDQRAVWQEVKKKWDNWQAGNLDVAFSYLHEEFLGWNEVDSLPVSKGEWVSSMKGMLSSVSEINFNIEPVKILVHQNSAVIHYNCEYSFHYRSGEVSQLIEDHGKWSEFLVKENERWMLLGEFTFHHNASKAVNSSRIETFTFSSKGNILTGRVYLPESYDSNKDLQAVYLVDFTEQHFKIANDEFERVINGVRKLQGVDALVVSLANIPDIDAEPTVFQEHYEIYRDMAAYVDKNYTNNASRTFIGKGSESGLVMMSLFVETKENSLFENFIVTDPSPHYATEIASLIINDDFPKNKKNKKLHFSFSTSNDRSKCTKLIELIEEAQYPWLQFKSIEYTESDYENTYPFAYAAGIRFVFDQEP
jgi:hypothetical protein